ncbi:MAG: DUF3306 domain-containing protein [Burkholderiales bacterium]|nr:DUF3306 domain-containing protein [Burkholderiales bacterium]
MADEPAGFLGRWARRKAQAREGKLLDEPVRTAQHSEPETAPVRVVVVPTVAAASESPPAQAAAPEQVPPVLTLDDAQALTQDSNFKPFMARQVQPEVRNAAMKKLFADPHFNVMDGLDIYIDDYTKSDPIPESMLRQMVGAKFLNLFDDAPEASIAASPRETADNPTTQTVAQSTLSPEAPPPAHDNPHLRLQPDHAAQPPGPGDGTS